MSEAPLRVAVSNRPPFVFVGTHHAANGSLYYGMLIDLLDKILVHNPGLAPAGYSIYATLGDSGGTLTPSHGWSGRGALSSKQILETTRSWAGHLHCVGQRRFRAFTSGIPDIVGELVWVSVRLLPAFQASSESWCRAEPTLRFFPLRGRRCG